MFYFEVFLLNLKFSKKAWKGGDCQCGLKGGKSCQRAKKEAHLDKIWKYLQNYFWDLNFESKFEGILQVKFKKYKYIALFFRCIYWKQSSFLSGDKCGRDFDPKFIVHSYKYIDETYQENFIFSFQVKQKNS